MTTAKPNDPSAAEVHAIPYVLYRAVFCCRLTHKGLRLIQHRSRGGLAFASSASRRVRSVRP